MTFPMEVCAFKKHRPRPSVTAQGHGHGPTHGKDPLFTFPFPSAQPPRAAGMEGRVYAGEHAGGGGWTQRQGWALSQVA